MLLKIETLVPREVTLVSMVNCWCAEMVQVRGSGDIFFFRENIMRHWCAEKTLVLLEIETLVPREVTLVSMVSGSRGSVSSKSEPSRRRSSGILKAENVLPGITPRPG